MSSSPDSPPPDEIRRLEERAARDPRTHTFARLADLYRKSGRLERALEVVEEGLTHHPHYLNARLVRARVLRELGRTDEATAAFRLVLEIDEDNLVALEALRSLEPAVGLRASRPDEGSGAGSTANRWLARLDADWRSRPGPAHPPDGDSENAAAPEAGSEDAAAPEADSEDAAAPEAARDDPAREPAPTAAAEPRAPEVPTATLASLYLSQGLYDEAIGVFEKLLARDPYNARLAQGLEEARRLHRRGSRPARAPGPAADGETAPRPPDRGDTERGAPAREGHRSAGRTGAVTIREFLGALLDGQAEVPEETPEGWRRRLERWLGGDGDDSPGG